MGKHFVYIVHCSDGTYYTGYTIDVENRLNVHNSGRGAKYVRGKTPVDLVYSKEYKNISSAMRAEREIKDLTRDKKKELIESFEKGGN